MRRRAFLNETARLRRRQSGVTPRHDTILEGVYELEPAPDFRTEARLAQQLNLDPVAVKTWFRNRRVRDKRANHRMMGSAIMLIVFVVLACVYLVELNGTPRPRRVVRELRATRPFFADATRRRPRVQFSPTRFRTRRRAGTERLMEIRRETAPANRQFRTKSGLPRPYKTKAPLPGKVQSSEGSQDVVVRERAQRGRGGELRDRRRKHRGRERRDRRRKHRGRSVVSSPRPRTRRGASFGERRCRARVGVVAKEKRVTRVGRRDEGEARAARVGRDEGEDA